MCCCHANNKKIDSEIDTILAGFVAHCNHYSEKNCTGHETYFFEYVAWFNVLVKIVPKDVQDGRVWTVKGC